MQDEISAAVRFLIRLIEKSENFNHDQLEEFEACLSKLLVERFQDHWFPDQPCKGQGYRCIRLNERDPRDAILEQAAIACGLKYEDFKLPLEFTLWVDPNEVCCRFGEHKGSYCTLAHFDKENMDLNKEMENDSEIAKETKEESTPLGVSNQRSSPKRAAGRGSSPRHKHGSPRASRGWGVHGGYQHPPLQSWYNLLPPHWLAAPSPSPYHLSHPLMRSPPMGKWGGHFNQHPSVRYWHSKPAVKV